MNILLIGYKGMLGQELVKVFDGHDLTKWDTDEIDISDKDQVFEKISVLKPDLIINAAAYTAVDDCEKNKDLAFAVNGYGPGNLGQIAKKINAILVHYSTDYIFNGQKHDGYDEEYNQVDPINVYGESKALGEKLIKESVCKFYIIRTAWLYGAGGKNFVDTMIELGNKLDEIKVVNDQYGSPTYAVDLAKATLDLIEEKKPFSIYHITNNENCTWYEFAKKIFKIKNIDIKVIPCTTEEFPRPAKRPEFSILINTKIRPLRPWQDALKEYLK